MRRTTLSVAIRSARTAGSTGAGRSSRAGGLPGCRVMGRNLTAAGPGTAGVGVLVAPGARPARAIALGIIDVIALRARYAGSAPMCGRLAAAHVLRRASRLTAMVYLLLLRAAAQLSSSIHLLRAALGLAFTIPGATATSFICHRIAPEPPSGPPERNAFRGDPVHFVRARIGGSAWDATLLGSRCFVFTIRLTAILRCAEGPTLGDTAVARPITPTGPGESVETTLNELPCLLLDR